jgi:hypothetical protein
MEGKACEIPVENADDKEIKYSAMNGKTLKWV